MERLVLDPEALWMDYSLMFRFRNVASMQKWLKGKNGLGDQKPLHE